MALLVVLAIIMFLVMKHPVAFWLIFVPLSVLLLLSIFGFFRNKRAGLSDLFTIMGIFVVIIVALVLIV